MFIACDKKLEKCAFLDKQRAIEEGFELAKVIARDTVLKQFMAKKSAVEVEIRALRPMLMKVRAQPTCSHR